MQQETTLKTTHPIQPFVLFGILMTVGFTFLNREPVSDLSISIGITILLLLIYVFWLSITENVITFDEESIRIKSNNRLPFSKTKDIRLEWNRINSINHNSPMEHSSRNIDNTLSIAFDNSHILYLSTYSYSKSSKKLKTLHQLLSKQASTKINYSSAKKVANERKSLWKEVKIILILISCLFIIPTITAHSNLSEPVKRFIMACTLFGFLASSMSIGLYMYFKNK